MEPQARYLWVGLGVILFCGCLTVFILWLSEATERTNYKYYTIYFKEHSLEGLQADSDVTMKGIKVGSVYNFHISSKDIERVKVTIRLKDDTPVKLNTRAVIRRNLLTGLANIDLIHSTTESPALTTVSQGEDYPEILEGQTELGALASTLPGMMEDVTQAIHRATGFFNDENQAKFQSILSNVERFTKVLGENDKDLHAMIQNISSVTKDIRDMSKSMGELSKKADTQVDKVGDQLTETLAQVKTATNNLDKRIGELSATLANSAQVLTSETTNVTQDVSVAAQNASRTLERFDDPKTLLLGPNPKSLGPGE